MTEKILVDGSLGVQSVNRPQPRVKFRFIQRLITDESGPTAVEYAIMLALIILVCASTIGSVGNAAYSSLWEAVEALE